MSHVPSRGPVQQARVRARRNAVQALYQWDMTSAAVEHVMAEFEAERTELRKADLEYFRELLLGVSAHQEELRQQLLPCLSRPLGELDPVERVILYLGTYELLYRPELPWRVVINESIDLAKLFGAEQSHRFINGVLDAVARSVRAVEIGAA